MARARLDARRRVERASPSAPARWPGVGHRTFQSGWGDTSFVAPQFNGSTAVIESYLGHRIGLWNPSVYSFAAGASSPVTPLNQAGTGNDNTFYTGTPASFATRQPPWASRTLPSSPVASLVSGNSRSG